MPHRTLIKLFLILVFFASLFSKDIEKLKLPFFPSAQLTILPKSARINILCKSISDENIRLKKLLKLKYNLTPTILASHVISYEPLSWSNTLIIDRGYSDNITPSSLILNEQGIIGQIIATQPNTSLISLLNNPNTQIPCITQITKIKGILTGTHTTLIFKTLNTSKSPLDHENILTLFTNPKSLPIGYIHKIITPDKSEYNITPLSKYDPTSPYVLILNTNEY